MYILLYAKDLWKKLLIGCVVLVCELVSGLLVDFSYIGLWGSFSKTHLCPHLLVESDGLVEGCMHVDSGLTWSIVDSRSFLFKFADHFSSN